METFKPTAAMARNALWALEVRDSKPPSQQGMTAVGLARANQLIRRDNLSLKTVRRMKAYFDRHAVDKQGATWGAQGKGWQAWMGWGGDEGWAWAKGVLAAVRRNPEPAEDFTSEELPLCPQEDMLPIVAAVRRNPEPALPPWANGVDFLNLTDIRTLVDDVLAFLGVKADGEVVVKWDRAMTRHGRARREPVIIKDAAGKNVVRPRYALGFSRKVLQLETREGRLDTILHETCHLAAFLLFPDRDVGHGEEWADLMRKVGAEPAVTADAPKGLHATWFCQNCEAVGTLTPKFAAMLHGGKALRCNKCGTALLWADAMVPPHMHARVERAISAFEAAAVRRRA